jgi:hypothetical protein
VYAITLDVAHGRSGPRGASAKATHVTLKSGQTRTKKLAIPYGSG